MDISVVIPTRNRPEHIRKVLGTICKQFYLPKEIIIVDASDQMEYAHEIHSEFNDTNITWVDSNPSVCIQRNTGIRLASSSWIFLCDDDIELPEDYLQKLVAYCDNSNHCGAVAGRLLQLEKKIWVAQYPLKNSFSLVWHFVFQLPIWGSIETIKSKFPYNFTIGFIKKWYHRRSNSTTLAGWPLITNWNDSIVKTQFYSLGANLIRKEWLLNSPYDEVLDPSGIGDNYGVALGFPQEQSIHVINSTFAYHHRAIENRLNNDLIQYRRVLALHYFMRRKPNNKRVILWLCWSLLGKILLSVAKLKLTVAVLMLKALYLILLDRNPYWVGFQKNKKCIQPF